MKISVRYFAHLRRTLGKKEEAFTLAEGAKVSDLMANVQEKCGRSLEVTRYQVTRKGSALDFAEELYDGDVIYIFPPVAGGISPLELSLLERQPPHVGLDS